MDDLISRSALISRFKQLQGSDTLANMFVSDVIKEVKKQPIAYNVDKVVEQIKGWSVKQHMPIANGSLGYVEYEVVNSDKAIELIKAGGVNG